MATKVTDEKRKFSYVATFDPFGQTDVRIMAGNRIYGYANALNDCHTANGCDTIAVPYDSRARRYAAVNIRDEKSNGE